MLTVLSLVAAINGLLTWIGKGFGIHALTLELILGYVFYPITFLLGVPRSELLKVSQLIATKLVANEFAAYGALQKLMTTDAALSHRGYTIASYALCGFANLGSLGIQIGVLGALAPSKSRSIARLAVSALICGFVSTLQTAGIAYVPRSPCLAFWLTCRAEGCWFNGFGWDLGVLLYIEFFAANNNTGG